MSGRHGKRRTRVDVDLDENEATVEVVKRRQVTDLFDENGELRLWQDAAGWSGYLVEDGDFFEVNWHRQSEGWIKFDVVDAETVVESVRDHIKDPAAGEAGVFVRRCSPP
ncbi:hypothetical protein [Haladaptatus sp. DYF46]|uniref:hypothetical protein n=1 Tax=Haladaptatus sp. DYF46 TaxID=2886041 RepID=UPI001E2C00CD|nr:hypothetical protein [Haladaptatus sp. DYF46]